MAYRKPNRKYVNPFGEPQKLAVPKDAGPYLAVSNGPKPFDAPKVVGATEGPYLAVSTGPKPLDAPKAGPYLAVSMGTNTCDASNQAEETDLASVFGKTTIRDVSKKSKNPFKQNINIKFDETKHVAQPKRLGYRNPFKQWMDPKHTAVNSKHFKNQQSTRHTNNMQSVDKRSNLLEATAKPDCYKKKQSFKENQQTTGLPEVAGISNNKMGNKWIKKTMNLQRESEKFQPISNVSKSPAWPKKKSLRRKLFSSSNSDNLLETSNEPKTICERKIYEKSFNHANRQINQYVDTTNKSNQTTNEFIENTSESNQTTNKFVVTTNEHIDTANGFIDTANQLNCTTNEFIHTPSAFNQTDEFDQSELEGAVGYDRQKFFESTNEFIDPPNDFNHTDEFDQSELEGAVGYDRQKCFDSTNEFIDTPNDFNHTDEFAQSELEGAVGYDRQKFFESTNEFIDTPSAFNHTGECDQSELEGAVGYDRQKFFESTNEFIDTPNDFNHTDEFAQSELEGAVGYDRQKFFESTNEFIDTPSAFNHTGECDQSELEGAVGYDRQKFFESTNEFIDTPNDFNHTDEFAQSELEGAVGYDRQSSSNGNDGWNSDAWDDGSIDQSYYGNTRLYICNLPFALEREALYEAFSAFGRVLHCSVARNEKGYSRGFGYVQFDSDAAARHAIERGNKMILQERKLSVHRFLPPHERERYPGPRTNFLNLFVKNFDPTFGDMDLQLMFEPFGNVTSCKIKRDIWGKSRNFAFVRFDSPKSAYSAIIGLNGKEVFPDRYLYVCRAFSKCNPTKVNGQTD